MAQTMTPSASGDDLTRRTFSALTVAAGVAGVAGLAQAAEVTATDVTYKTTDGTVDAALFHPSGKGQWPGVLFFPDAFGLRPATRDMGRRLAAQGYVVLVVNQFYRNGTAATVPGPLNFADPADMAKFTALRAVLTQEAVARDTVAAVAYLDSLPATNSMARIGVQGYCMGGPMTLQAAAASPRIGASASFHGGGLTTDAPNSPHLLAPKIQAVSYFGVADDDDRKQPDSKDKLRTAYAAAGKTAKIEVYPGALHGWTMKDSDKYNEAAAERAWSELLALYKQALV